MYETRALREGARSAKTAATLFLTSKSLRKADQKNRVQGPQ